ncbi:MAG: molybdopterin-binding protein [Sulfurospirillaceae bacterium]|nr:molybdopterin-binding protein [Sulfurospirillaceae bacterium]
MNTYNFYSVIIGTELLNGRRVDKHFSFINEELTKRGLTHAGNFVIIDNPPLMEKVFNILKEDKNAVMFCFGGIGSTPDDYTRVVAAKVFTDGKMQTNQKALSLIIDSFGDQAYPHRVKMANIPIGAQLLENVVNKVPGFSLEDRYFFTPGFPSMAWPMLTKVLDTKFEKKPKNHFCTFHVDTSENDLIDIMEAIPEYIELSSLPKIEKNKKSVEIYLACEDENKLKTWCDFFKQEMLKLQISFK